MSFKEVEKLWNESSFTKPKILFLYSSGKYFAVVEDNTNIVVVVSKTEIVYAVAKNRLQVTDAEAIPVYYLEDSEHLKIISCTRESIEKRHKDQYFVLSKIIKYI